MNIFVCMLRVNTGSLYSVVIYQTSYDLQDAVFALNNLQSNAAELEAKQRQQRKQNDNIELMQKSLQHLNIHVSVFTNDFPLGRLELTILV